MKNQYIPIAVLHYFRPNKLIQLIGLYFIFCNVGYANYIYSYTGNNYDTVFSDSGLNLYDTSMNLTLTFTTDSLLTNQSGAGNVNALITGFSIFDGVFTFNQTNVDSYEFRVITDGAGNILQWLISADVLGPWSSIGDTKHRIGTLYSIAASTPASDSTTHEICLSAPLGDCGLQRSVDYAYINSNIPGSWTIDPIPIPSALWLFGSGLLGLIGISKRKKAA